MKKYSMEVDCANCANKMEQAAAKVAGVKSVNINFFAQKMMIEFEEGATPETVMPQVLKVCKKVESDCTIDF